MDSPGVVKGSAVTGSHRLASDDRRQSRPIPALEKEKAPRAAGLELATFRGAQRMSTFRGLASSTLGKEMVSRPSWKVAATWSALTLAGRVKERENEPYARSIR